MDSTLPVDESTLNDFIENMTADGCLGLLTWAKRDAPHLLKILITSFLTGHAPKSELKATANQREESITSPARKIKLQENASLRGAERSLITWAVADSRTLGEAASRLGISYSTLWRKRKLYGLR